uniref:Zgc:100829 n=1 Tax=Oryzias sinensis TaxID=183150 RepID=A0A8C7ZJ90_9TELE
MLQQVLKEMYIDPDVLQALNEEQKKILFLKMREEQVRRWKEREEKLGREPELKPAKQKSANGKSVSWQLGRDGEVSVSVMGEVDELTSKFLSSKLLEKPQKERGFRNVSFTRRYGERQKTSHEIPSDNMATGEGGTFVPKKGLKSSVVWKWYRFAATDVEQETPPPPTLQHLPKVHRSQRQQNHKPIQTSGGNPLFSFTPLHQT